MKQIYSNYTNEDHQVWQILFDRQVNNLSKVASKEYLSGIEKVGFTRTRIPDFDETNALLAKQTGWSLHVVPGIIPVKEFFGLLIQKKFSATTWLRKMHQLDYIEEPDMFHDVFGHVPLLSNTSFSNFVHGLSRIAVKHMGNDYAQELLGRIYWFTLEFGLIREDDELRIYGAGICSSVGETRHSLSDASQKLPFSVGEMLRTPFRNDRIQDKYFVIGSFDELFRSLPLIEAELERLLVESDAQA
ncbi:MAG: phenylalanine 4-monooxygenase [Bacteroidota bacterium]